MKIYELCKHGTTRCAAHNNREAMNYLKPNFSQGDFLLSYDTITETYEIIDKNADDHI